MGTMAKQFSKINFKLSVPSVLGSVVAATCLATASSAFSPASAFIFTTQQGTAGNPVGQPLYDVGITTEDVGKSFDIDWLVSKETIKTPAKLSATGKFTVTGLTNNLLSLEVKITNTTDANFQAAITSMGFGVSPDATSVSFASGGAGSVFKTTELQTKPQNFPGGFKNIDACVSANGCSGGNVKDGLQSGGNSDTYKVNIAGTFNMDYSGAKATMTSFPVKFQTSDGSYEVTGTGRRKVPEPATTGALGVVALGAFGLLKRKAVAES